MCLNFSKAKSQSNLTFRELNCLMDNWIPEIQEIHNVYSLQSDEINKFTYNVSNSREKLEHLHKRITMLKWLQENIDSNLNNICNSQKEIEPLVKRLEASMNSLSEKHIPRDIFRLNTYKLAEILGYSFCNFKSVIDDIETSMGNLDKDYMCDGNIEQIAQLLQIQLQQLETIEMRVYEMKNSLNQTEYAKQRVLNSLRLKENKY